MWSICVYVQLNNIAFINHSLIGTIAWLPYCQRKTSGWYGWYLKYIKHQCLLHIDFFAVWPWNLTDDLQKLQGTSPKPHQALCNISPPYVNSNWSYSPETAKWVLTSVTLTFDLWRWPFAWTLLLSWQFHDDSMKGTLWKRCNRRTDGRTDRRKEVFLGQLGRSSDSPVFGRPIPKSGDRSLQAPTKRRAKKWPSIFDFD